MSDANDILAQLKQALRENRYIQARLDEYERYGGLPDPAFLQMAHENLAKLIDLHREAERLKKSNE